MRYNERQVEQVGVRAKLWRLAVGIQVLVERVGKGRFRATSGEPLPATAEARTRDAALAKLKKEVGKRLRNGAELVSMDLTAQPQQNPWTEFAGMFADDPWIEDWKRSMADYRRQKDAEPEANEPLRS
jgi:hypothetical protein